MDSQLTPLQEQILALLAEMEPPWTLTGGAALAGVHLGLRPTRDLDLFWHGVAELGRTGREVTVRLEAAGLTVTRIQGGATFERLRVASADDVCVVDLVAEPVPPVEDQRSAVIGGATVLVDTPHEILVNKLCAALGRSEVRDLQDIHDLLAHGGDLERALADAPRKDAGFSPLTLAYSLRTLDVAAIGAVAGLDASSIRALDSTREELVRRVTDASRPEDG